MKSFVVSFLVLAMSQAAFAKIEDFNSMIADNLKEQTQVQDRVNEHLNSKEETSAQQVVVIDDSTESFSTKSAPELFVFNKESAKPSNKVSKKNLERVATEIEAEKSF